MTREEAAANIAKHFEYMYHWITPKEVLEVAYEALQQPEIIRCKDCRFREKHFDGAYWCREHGIPITGRPDFYCADGKKLINKEEILWQTK